MLSKRTSWQVTRSAWHAMFIREALARTTADRLASFWMLAEPIAMISIMAFIRTLGAAHIEQISGADFIPWMILGLLGFFLFRENMTRSMGAITSNRALFAYRQVKPIDPVLVRCYLEGLLKTFIFLLFIAIGILLGFDLVPDHPLMALFCWFSLWMLGLGVGLILSAVDALVPEIGRIVKIMSMPLLIGSGVIMPLHLIPHRFLEYLMLNPIVHGLEALRGSFFEGYREVPGTSLEYLWFWTLAMTTLGLMLHMRFEKRLKRR